MDFVRTRTISVRINTISDRMETHFVRTKRVFVRMNRVSIRTKRVFVRMEIVPHRMEIVFQRMILALEGTGGVSNGFLQGTCPVKSFALSWGGIPGAPKAAADPWHPEGERKILHNRCTRHKWPSNDADVGGVTRPENGSRRSRPVPIPEAHPMSTIPLTPRSEFISWCLSHQDLFADNQAAIGLSAGQVASFNGAIVQYDSAWKAADAARQASKDATTDLTLKFNDLKDIAAEIVRTVKTHAENTGNLGIYGLAGLPLPSERSVIPPPTQPTDFVVLLSSSGGITLQWKSEGVNGAFFLVDRRVGNSATWTSIGGSGNREFTDNSLPIGTTNVQYRVHGVRGNVPGPMSLNLAIQFGVVGGPTVTGGSLQMAA